jgi:hypothetical protein
MVYGPLLCECGSSGACNDLLLRKAARIDAIVAAKQVDARLNKEMSRIRNDKETLEMAFHAADFKQTMNTSLALEKDLRQKLYTASANEIAQLAIQIGEEERVRREAAGSHQLHEQLRDDLAKQAAQLVKERDQHRKQAHGLMDFSTL